MSESRNPPSNFGFLIEHWAFLHGDAQQVESYALRDPRAAAIYARRTLELSLRWLFANDTALKTPYDKSLAAMIHEPTFAGNIRQGLFHDIKFIHRLGNIAAHGDQHISAQESLQAAMALHMFLGWLSRVYTRQNVAPQPFQADWLPKSEPQTPPLTVQQLEQLQDQLAARDAAATAAHEKLTRTEAELIELRTQLAALQQLKQANQQSIGSSEYTEAQTRELMIDVMLREAGWDPKAANVAEFEVHQCMPTATGERNGTGYMDYVLWGSDGKPLALVEAKKTRKDPLAGKHQAALYANCLEQQFGQRPVIYYSNGYTTWLWDDSFYPPREVQGFATRDELQWCIHQRSLRQALHQLQPKPDIAGRHYQIEAAARVMEHFGRERKRKSLIVMATGTGKTRLAIALVDMLMRANWARRVLFLADRIALVNQAKREFNRLLPHVSVASLLEPMQCDARVVFSTYPTMLNCIDGTRRDIEETFSVAHFDLLIIDEAHRSVYQKYGAIFNYFDALLLGLTATPRGEVDRNTYRLFELDDHQPTYAYELEQAVNDEYLVPPRAMSVPLKFQRDGIHYYDLSPEEQEEYEQQERFYDEESGELKEAIDPPALNHWLFNEDTVNQVLMYLMENGIKVEGGDQLGKTIIFAKNSKHADFIVERFDKHYPHYAGKFCQKIDFSVKYAQSLIDDFKEKHRFPQIAVSVDMLDTGIDVPEIVNLVFFKLVRSRVKFWQMIGRGTRLCDNLFAPGEHKKEFIIFDYCQNLEFFDANPTGYDAAAQESVKQKIFKRRLELAVALQNGQPEGAATRDFAAQLKDQLHSVVTTLNRDNFIVRKQLQAVEQYAQRDAWQKLGEHDVKMLTEQISGLPAVDSDDEYTRRFDFLILNLQLAILQRNPAQANYQRSVQQIARELEDKAAIPSVAAQMALILELQTDGWWQDVTLPMLEDVRVRLRGLTRFITPEERIDVYTHFTDQLIRQDVAEYDVVKRDPSLQNYRKRVQRFIREHQDHVTIRRLKNNEPITPTDIAALEVILFAENGPIPKDEYQKTYGKEPLGKLVRSIVGLNRNAAKAVFAGFLAQHPTMNADQMTFLNEIVEYLVKNGVMEPRVIFETPFNHYHESGVVGVFGDELSRQIVERIDCVNKNAGMVAVK
ncbi:DEAD/DEAH box helicase family protein [Nitrosomonas sp. Nm166]|uniref:DEAD/DEAH box helicase family protein n=1 Tax=Nitrosomonas sp. Nm166 TaxID=1881054 RepID=UPI0008E18F96|nr:DEAD/DEAH box helicase family protein [Nitrosomonas sp. Nm166]SFF24387.1 type I restriction enzyme, R subunit [Nitrosomonas sp. Nm166]